MLRIVMKGGSFIDFLFARATHTLWKNLVLHQNAMGCVFLLKHNYALRK